MLFTVPMFIQLFAETSAKERFAPKTQRPSRPRKNNYERTPVWHRTGSERWSKAELSTRLQIRTRHYRGQLSPRILIKIRSPESYLSYNIYRSTLQETSWPSSTLLLRKEPAIPAAETTIRSIPATQSEKPALQKQDQSVSAKKTQVGFMGGKLQQHTSFWHALTYDTVIRQAIKGYTLEFIKNLDHNELIDNTCETAIMKAKIENC